MKNYHEMADEIFHRRDEYVRKQKIKRKVILKAIYSTACVCVITFVSVGIWYNLVIDKSDITISNSNTYKKDNFDKVKSKNQNNPKQEKTLESKQDIKEESNIGSNIKNNPVEKKNVNSKSYPKELLKQLPDYFGGSYIDDNGNFVVFLTEDTNKNRVDICHNLNLDNNKTIFKKANYSYTYLLKLQDCISRAMENDDLPFVISSALKDDENFIEVTVQTDNKNDIDKLKKFDVNGGAIKIQLSSTSVNEDVLTDKQQ